MKKQILLFVILISGLTANAQWFTKEAVQNHQSVDKKPLSWGYYIGFNNLDFKFDYKTPVKDIITEKSAGFNVGLIGNARITDHIDVRLEPGLVISTRTLFFDESYFDGIPEEDVKSTYVYIPLLLKLSTTRINNFRPFILAGLSTALNLSSNQDNPEDNSSGNYRTKKNVSFYEVGFGIDFYLSYFKFTPSIRGVIESQQTRGVFINFTFQ